MTAVATVAPWQHSSPGGGLISTSWTPAERLEPGMVIRHGGWCPITTIYADTVHRMTVVVILCADGIERHRLFIDGAETRDDMTWSPTPISACGCWRTDGGTWTCDKHLRRHRLVREANRRPRSYPHRPLRRI